MQPPLVSCANIHARTYAYRLQAFENLNILFVITPIPIGSIPVAPVSTPVIPSATLQVIVLYRLACQSRAFILYLFCH
jgi:hypothetical protein